MTIPTRRQGVALSVFRCVKSIKDAGDKGEKTKTSVAAYAGYAVELPSLIRNNGLAQTLAFLKHKAESKAESEDSARAAGARSLRTDLCKVLRDVENQTRPRRATERGDVSVDETAATLDSFDYLVASRRALEASEYFKRFAESVLDAGRGQRGAQS